MIKLRLSTFVARTGEANTNTHTDIQTQVQLFLLVHFIKMFYSIRRSKVGELLPHVSSLKIHLQYAKAKEADGK